MLSVSSGGFIVRVNGSEYIPDTEATTLESGITLSYNGSFEIGTPLGSGVQIKEAANGTFFTFVTAFLSSYENSSFGLSGKWNGNMDDDFTLPDGTVLPINLNDSEIFYKFGEACELYIIKNIFAEVLQGAQEILHAKNILFADTVLYIRNNLIVVNSMN